MKHLKFRLNHITSYAQKDPFKNLLIINNLIPELQHAKGNMPRDKSKDVQESEWQRSTWQTDN